MAESPYSRDQPENPIDEQSAGQFVAAIHPSRPIQPQHAVAPVGPQLHHLYNAQAFDAPAQFDPASYYCLQQVPAPAHPTCYGNCYQSAEDYARQQREIKHRAEGERQDQEYRAYLHSNLVRNSRLREVQDQSGYTISPYTRVDPLLLRPEDRHLVVRELFYTRAPIAPAPPAATAQPLPEPTQLAVSLARDHLPQEELQLFSTLADSLSQLQLPQPDLQILVVDTPVQPVPAGIFLKWIGVKMVGKKSGKALLREEGMIVPLLPL